MKKSLVKAEILFTRVCPLNCSYCYMIRRKENIHFPKEEELVFSQPYTGWRKVIDGLKKVNVPFFAIYGAEPLVFFDQLCDFIRYSDKNDILTTLITSCVGLTEKKMEKLVNSGLRSLTVSLDNLDIKKISDKNVQKKSSLGLEWIFYFKQIYGDKIRDAEVVYTVERSNIEALPDAIKYFTSHGIWLHFDYIEYDRGQYDSKCAPKEQLKGRYLEWSKDRLLVKDVFSEVLSLKKKGYLIHPSESLIEEYMTKRFVNLQWQCNKPGFVSIDANGVVRVGCDDFTNPDCKDTPIYAWELDDKWDLFWKKHEEGVRYYNCRCAWSTHYDAQLIYNNLHSASHYYHIETPIRNEGESE